MELICGIADNQLFVYIYRPLIIFYESLLLVDLDWWISYLLIESGVCNF